MLDAAIFCLFAPFGIAIHMMTFGQGGWTMLVWLIVLAGVLALLYARAGFSGRLVPYLSAGFIVQAVMMWVVRNVREAAEHTIPDASVIDTLNADARVLFGFIALGYGLLISIFATQGARFWATSTEIRLAQRIHRRLVPPIEGRNRDVEWAGISTPSGDIGGDLVDVVEGPGGLVGCVADVSGHGVGAGLLMGMFKTAFRSSVARLSDPAELLAEIHVALSPLTEPNMFATAGILRVSGRTMQYAGGGHPPLLLYRRATGKVEEIASTGPAIALLEDFFCGARELRFEPGDTALLLTDGIFEAIDASEREVGLEAVKGLLAAHASAPLQDILARVAALQPTRTREDDQTVLIVRAV